MASTTSKEPVAFPPTVVFGGGGRVGRMLQVYWADDPVTWTSRNSAGKVLELDLLADGPRVAEVADGAEVAICLAGIVPGQGDLSQNTDLAIAAIDAATKSSVSTVILCSSAAVYGRGAGAWKEDMRAKPISAYGQAKLDMEQAAQDHAAKSGLRVCRLRIGNIAGADAILGGWTAGFTLDQLLDGTTPLRSYIGPSGFAAVLANLVSKADQLPDVLNLAVPKPVRMGDLLNSAGLSWLPRSASEETIADVVLNVDRLQELVAIDDAMQDVAADWASWRAREDRI